MERQDEGLERRPEADWIVVEDAWDALVDAATFEKVQGQRRLSRDRHRQVTGMAVRSEYLLTGLFVCGVCGAPMMGQTKTSGKGVRTRYYICNDHHRGLKDRCGQRYTVPAELVEQHVIGLIRADLEKLHNGERVAQYIAQEKQRALGADQDAAGQLERRLADLDQQLAKLRDHLKSMDAATAQAVGLYDDARQLAQERQEIEAELQRVSKPLPALPEESTLQERAKSAAEYLDEVLTVGTIEEKRAAIRLYVETIKADPTRHRIEISLYSALFTSKIACTQRCSAGPDPKRNHRPAQIEDISYFGHRS